MLAKNVHQSSVNFKNLIRDLAEMYSQEISEVIIIELIANALDAKATLIKVNYDEKKKILSIEDNGEGMEEKQFATFERNDRGAHPHHRCYDRSTLCVETDG